MIYNSYKYERINLCLIIKKSLIIYFSRADENYSVGYIDKGNTEVIAEYIKEFTDSDIIKIEPKIPYSKDYNTCINEAKERQLSHNAPIINIDIDIDIDIDISNYDVIYIGSPVYWGIMPEELVTALKRMNFENKIIIPFLTHEGSKFGNILNQINEICKNATVKEGLEIFGSHVYESKLIVREWLSSKN